MTSRQLREKRHPACLEVLSVLVAAMKDSWTNQFYSLLQETRKVLSFEEQQCDAYFAVVFNAPYFPAVLILLIFCVLFYIIDFLQFQAALIFSACFLWLIIWDNCESLLIHFHSFLIIKIYFDHVLYSTISTSGNQLKQFIDENGGLGKDSSSKYKIFKFLENLFLPLGLKITEIYWTAWI